MFGNVVWHPDKTPLAESLKRTIMLMSLYEGYRAEFDNGEYKEKVVFRKIANKHQDAPEWFRIDCFSGAMID
jgi:hypothetical protein